MSITVDLNLRDYLERVRKEWETGVATEESYRPAFKALLEGGDGRFRAITESCRIACGAPDFVVQRSGTWSSPLVWWECPVPCGSPEPGL